jgi:hypothetical protein
MDSLGVNKKRWAMAWLCHDEFLSVKMGIGVIEFQMHFHESPFCRDVFGRHNTMGSLEIAVASSPWGTMRGRALNRRLDSSSL